MSDKKDVFALMDLELTEVSLVDEGANPGAKIALIKRKQPSSDNVSDKSAEQSALLKTGGTTMTPEEMQAQLDELKEQNVGLMAKIEDLSTENAKLKQDASEAATPAPEEEVAPVAAADGDVPAEDDEVAASKADDEDEVAASKADDETSPEAVAARKRMTTLEKSNKKLQETVSKMVEREEIAKYTDMGNAYSNFPVKPEDIGKVLRVVNKNQEAGEILEQILSSGHEALNKVFSATADYGSESHTDAESSFYTERDKIASEENVTKQKATQLAKKRHPEKWAEMRKSQAQH